jgi:hypothetical protein
MAKIIAIELENFQSINDRTRVGFSSRDILYGESIKKDEVVTNALELIKKILNQKTYEATKLVDDWYVKEVNQSKPCSISIEFEMNSLDRHPEKISEEYESHLSPTGVYFLNGEVYNRDKLFDYQTTHRKPLEFRINITFLWTKKKKNGDYLVTNYEVLVNGREILKYWVDPNSLDGEINSPNNLCGFLTINDEQQFDNPFFSIDIFSWLDERTVTKSCLLGGLLGDFLINELQENFDTTYIKDIGEELNYYLGRNLIKAFKHLKFLRSHAREIMSET